jgi:hypothetical protein
MKKCRLRRYSIEKLPEMVSIATGRMLKPGAFRGGRQSFEAI